MFDVHGVASAVWRSYFSQAYLIENPALVWIIGFPLVADPLAKHGFDVEASLPDRRQLGRILRELPNPAPRFPLT